MPLCHYLLAEMKSGPISNLLFLLLFRIGRSLIRVKLAGRFYFIRGTVTMKTSNFTEIDINTLRIIAVQVWFGRIKNWGLPKQNIRITINIMNNPF